MLILRACAGFMLFHLAFLFRGEPNEKTLIGAAVALSALGTMAGNASAPRLRAVLHEERMITVALVLPAVAGIVAAVVGGAWAGIAVAAIVNLSAALCRLSFESIVQRDGPATNRGQAFARFETRFQLGWVIAAVLPVLLEMPGAVGNLLVGAGTGAAVVNYRAGLAAGPVAVTRR